MEISGFSKKVYWTPTSTMKNGNGAKKIESETGPDSVYNQRPNHSRLQEVESDTVKFFSVDMLLS